MTALGPWKHLIFKSPTWTLSIGMESTLYFYTGTQIYGLYEIDALFLSINDIYMHVVLTSSLVLSKYLMLKLWITLTYQPSSIQLKCKNKQETKKSCLPTSVNLGKLIRLFFLVHLPSPSASPFAFIRNKSKILLVSFEFIILTARHLLPAAPFV